MKLKKVAMHAYEIVGTKFIVRRTDWADSPNSWAVLRINRAGSANKYALHDEGPYKTRTEALASLKGQI